MINYILKQWKQKKSILSLIVAGFLIGSLFLSVGASLTIENYNHIMDYNSGNPSEQLDIEIEYGNIKASELVSQLNKIAEYGEIQIVSLANTTLKDGSKCQIVPVQAKEYKGWHIPIISGSYFKNGRNEIVVGKNIAKEKNLSVGKIAKLDNKEYKVIGISGRKNKETTWDEIIYMNLEDYVENYKSELFKKDRNLLSLVLKRGKDEFIADFDKIKDNFEQKGISIDFEEIRNEKSDNSSIFNSVVMTVVSSGIIFVIAMINIMNLMIYWMLERKKEIGIMKALGATDRFVVKWVVIELVMMSIIGAILAIICQMILGRFICQIIGNDVNIDVSWFNCIIAIIVSAFFGTFASIFIAIRTLKFNPAEVMSCE